VTTRDATQNRRNVRRQGRCARVVAHSGGLLHRGGALSSKQPLRYTEADGPRWYTGCPRTLIYKFCVYERSGLFGSQCTGLGRPTGRQPGAMNAGPTTADESQGSVQKKALSALAEEFNSVDGVWIHPNIDAVGCSAVGCSRGSPLARVTIARFGMRVVCLRHTVDLLQRETTTFPDPGCGTTERVQS
jgi:hypothetical protein